MTPDDDPPAVEVARLCAAASSVPLPGGGSTARRWRVLRAIGRADLSLARVGEAHLDAVAILAELGGHPPGSGAWGVWAAHPPGALRAEQEDGRWLLRGAKPWCSGTGIVHHALVTADAPDGRRLLAVDVRAAGVRGTVDWQVPALRAARTGSVSFDAAVAYPVGGPGEYLSRPGFWHGAVGVAAVWQGGAERVLRTWLASSRTRAVSPHAKALLGRASSALAASGALLGLSARHIDADPGDHRGDAVLVARSVRAVVESACETVLEAHARATGPGPLVDPRHAQHVADLRLYLRQSHGDADLAALGDDVLSRTGHR